MATLDTVNKKIIKIKKSDLNQNNPIFFIWKKNHDFYQPWFDPSQVTPNTWKTILVACSTLCSVMGG